MTLAGGAQANIAILPTARSKHRLFSECSTLPIFCVVSYNSHVTSAHVVVWGLLILPQMNPPLA